MENIQNDAFDVNNTPQPDTRITEEFLRWWFSGCTSGVVEIGWKEKTGTLNKFRQYQLGDWHALAEAAAYVNAHGADVYFRAATMHMHPGASSDSDFVQSPGLWADHDKDVAAAVRLQTAIRPSGVVLTGTVPEMRVHSWFKADSLLADGDLVNALNKRVRELYGSDPAVVNPSTLMRLPGCISWPHNKPDKPGRVPELVTFSPGPRCYSTEVLDRELPASVEPESNPATSTSGQKADDPLMLLSAFNAIPNTDATRGQQQWNWWNRLGMALWAATDGSEAGRLIWHAWSRRSPKYSPEATEERWNHWSQPGHRIVDLGAGTIIHEAKAAGWERPKTPAECEFSAEAKPAAVVEAERLFNPWDVLDPPPFPMDAVPGVIRLWAEDRAHALGADPAGLAMAGLVAHAGAMDGMTRLRMGSLVSTWRQPPALWLMLIGDPAAKKTPILSEALRPITEADRRDIQDWQARHAVWAAKTKKERDQEPEPRPRRRLIINDATTEALQRLLSWQNRGVIVHRDELAGLIGNFDRYGSQGADRPYWLELYEGNAYGVDRIGRGYTASSNTLASLIGGIQPDRLAKLGDLTDDGLFQRFIPFRVADAGIGNEESLHPGAAEAYAASIRKLLDSTDQDVFPREWHLSPEAIEVRQEIERFVYDLAVDHPLGKAHAGFLLKVPSLWGRLCLAIQAASREADNADDFMANRIGLTVAQAAHRLTRCILRHSFGAYMALGNGGTTDREIVLAVAGYVLAKRKTRLLASELKRDVRQCRDMTLAEVNEAVSPLVAGGWMDPDAGEGFGHWTNKLVRGWTVNNAVHTQFAEKAAEEIDRRSRVREKIAKLYNSHPE